MDEFNIDPFLATASLIIAASAAYGKLFGKPQMTVTQWIIDASQIESRFRGVTNMAVGLALSLPFAVIIATELDIKTGSIFLLGGFIASIEAARIHDEEKAAILPTRR